MHATSLTVDRRRLASARRGGARCVSHHRTSCAHGPAHARTAPATGRKRAAPHVRGRARLFAATVHRDRVARARRRARPEAADRTRAPGTAAAAHPATPRPRYRPRAGARARAAHPTEPSAPARPACGHPARPRSSPRRSRASPGRARARDRPVGARPGRRPRTRAGDRRRARPRRGSARAPVIPAVVSPVLIHPSSCQRTRSASTPGVSASPSSERACRQQRVSRSPCSVSASTSTRVHARPRSASRSSNRSASSFAANAAMSTRSAGGSSSVRSTRSGGGATSTDGPGSMPRASSWIRRPSTAEAGEHRVGRQRGDRAERRQAEPDEQAREIVVVEHRHRPRRDELGRSARGHDHRTPGREPGDEHTVGDPDAHVVAVGTERGGDRRRGSAPRARRRRRSSATDRGSGTRTDPGRSSTTRGVNTSIARATTSNVRASFASSASTHTASGQRASASRRRIPRVTPTARASADAHAHDVAAPDPLAHDERPVAQIVAPMSSACRRAAITGQSGHHTQPVRAHGRPRHPGRACRARACTPFPSTRTSSSRGASSPPPAHEARPVAGRCAWRRRDASTGHGPSATSTVARSRAGP